MAAHRTADRPREPILIAGGGIAGLSAATALSQAGFPVRVLERSATFPDAGAGIQLGPNATRLLRAWGVLERLERGLVRPSTIRIRDGRSGARIANMPLGAEAEARYGAPYVVLQRCDLQQGLLEAARAQANVEVITGTAVARAEAEPQGVTVHAADGRSLRGRALIAADGLFSSLRPRVAPGAQLHFTGHTAWRTLIPAEACPKAFLTPDVSLWLAPGAHLVHYPVRGGAAVNVVAVVPDDWRGEGWDGHGDPSALLPHFAAWAAPARDGLQAAPDWRKWALFRAPPLKRWSDGAMALIGDAAHPVLPYLAQGAALAVEDAAALAGAAARSPDDLAAAFTRYAAARRARVARVQRAARVMGTVYHLGTLPALARNAALRLRSPRALLRRFDWLYAHEAQMGPVP